MRVFSLVAVIFYALSALNFGLARSGGSARWMRVGLTALVVGVALHGIDLVVGSLRAGNLPVGNFPEALSFLAWLTALAGLVLIARFRFAVVGAFTASAAFVALGIAAMLMRRGKLVLPAALRSGWLPIHVTLAFLGYSLFLLAAGVSALYLVYESRLKGKHPFPVGGPPTPSLERLDFINYRLLGWGFLMLSLAIVSGSIWAEATWGHFWSWEPQESWSLVTWLLYAALLESRLTVGWRGRRAAALTLVVFTVLLGSFVGVSLFHPGKHGGSFD